MAELISITKGTDTFNTTISMACLLAAMHPWVQDKIHAELEEHFGASDEDVTEERMKQLTYLSCFIKEAMRFCPAVGAVGRTTTQDIDIGERWRVTK
jgi:cytochrome P450